MTQITPQQLAQFDTFGFLKFPGLLREEISWIIAEFEAVFTDRGIVHDGTLRSCIVPFADSREKLCGLLDHPSILAIANGLLGDDFNYIGSDGNYYTGDTSWHTDGWHEVGRFIKIAFYLDPVGRDTGALRVIPGSHRTQLRPHWNVYGAGQSERLWGLKQSEVPSVALETQPGDVLVFNHNILHSAFGGTTRRRMFTLNLSAHAETSEDRQELRGFINAGARFWVEKPYSNIMMATATAQRRIHLDQVLAHADELPALVAKAKLTMTEPSRG